MGSRGRENRDENNNENEKSSLQKSYFEVLGLCCAAEEPLIEKILKPLEGVIQVSVIVPSRTVIVLHDPLLISQLQIVKVLNQARLEANIRVKGKTKYRGKWPSPYVILSGLALALSLLKYVYQPFQWLAVAAVAVGIWPVIMRGVVAIRNFTLDVNILMLIAVVGTIAMKDYLEAGTIVFLFTIAQWLELRASHKATAVMSSLMSMAPQKATAAETGEVVNVEDVKLNTILAVKAGEIIPIDGIVVEGTCEVDEKTLTGESFPVTKQKDSIVWAGTVNVNGYVSVKTTALAEDCAVAKMAKLVEEAQNNKSSVQRLIDKCAKYYTPAVVLISAGLVVVPAILKLHNLRHWFHLALVVLVSACPCGLILSTPVATFCALSRAATAGLLIKGGDYLEILAKIKVMAFDKTGTITRGEFTLVDFQTLADDVSLSTVLYWVSSIESKSSHPIATVLVEYGRSQSIEPKPENVEDFQNFPGEGVFGKIDGRDVYIGNQKLGQRANCTIGASVGGDMKERRTTGFIYSGGALIGIFSLSDSCRSGAIDAIKYLKSIGIRTTLLTGDGHSAAMHAQEQLGHTLDVVHAELLPEDKARIIQEYKKEGPTAMVGDGVNDAPALATADIGISMGVSGSALAIETGHVVLMSNDIRKIPKAIKLAKKTRRKVIENIIISITTKAGVLAFAFAGHPLVWLAVLVDVATCLIVIFNSMLLLRGTRAHGKKCVGIFSCHSHETKCNSTSEHSKMNQQCCSKGAAPKCSSGNHSTPCHSTDGLHLSKKRRPCSTVEAPTTSESSKCSSQHCSTSCQTSKCIEPSYQLHQHLGSRDSLDKHCSSHASECASKFEPTHDDSSACEGKVCGPCDTCDGDGRGYFRSDCCREDHCLDLLESQGSCGGGKTLDEGTCCGSGAHEVELHEGLSGCSHDHSNDSDMLDKVVKHEAISGCAHGHSSDSESHSVTNHQHHKHKTRCEVLDRDNTSCRVPEQQSSSHHGSIGLMHNENNGSHCKDHCSKSHGTHRENHHFGSHGRCHGKVIAKHACSSLRKREVGACCKSYRKECCHFHGHGHFLPGFGGLTEIVTE